MLHEGALRKNTTEQMAILPGKALSEYDRFGLIEVFMYGFISHVTCPQ